MLNDYLGFPQCVEDFTIEQFIPKLAVEGFAITVFLRPLYDTKSEYTRKSFLCCPPIGHSGKGA